MVDAILGLVVAVIATSALTLAVEVSEASFARKGSLDPGMSTYEWDVLKSADLSEIQQEAFKNFLKNSLKKTKL